MGIRKAWLLLAAPALAVPLYGAANFLHELGHYSYHSGIGNGEDYFAGMLKQYRRELRRNNLDIFAERRVAEDYLKNYEAWFCYISARRPFTSSDITMIQSDDTFKAVVRHGLKPKHHNLVGLPNCNGSSCPPSIVIMPDNSKK